MTQLRNELGNWSGGQLNKEFTVYKPFCEHEDCFNFVGYSGSLVENPKTHERRMVCTPCLKQWYSDWKVLLSWR